MAADGDPSAIRFPRGLTGPRDAAYDFSFSGLKTAVARFVEGVERTGGTVPVADVCASFQEAVADVLTAKTVRAATDLGIGTVVVAGGVAANGRLRALAAAALRRGRPHAAHPAARSVHRQRRDDRRRRRPPAGRGSAAVGRRPSAPIPGLPVVAVVAA